MTADFEAGIRAALEVIDAHGWLGVSHTIRVQLLGYTGPEAVEESELRAWRATAAIRPRAAAVTPATARRGTAKG